MSISFENSINQEKPIFLGPLHTKPSVNINFKECIDCPELCVNCIKKLCGIANAKLDEDKYNVVYVSSGKVMLFFPYTKTAEQLDANQLMLIPNETKFELKCGNIFSASCVVANVNGRQAKVAHKNIAKPNCMFRKSH